MTHCLRLCRQLTPLALARTQGATRRFRLWLRLLSAGSLRRLFAAAMAQGKLGYSINVLGADSISRPPSSVSPRSAQPDQIRPQTVYACGEAALGDDRQGVII